MTSRETNPAEIAARPSHRDRRVLVTGAGRGIGQAIALGFARRGASVGVADVTAADVAATVAAIEAAGGKALPLVLDVADYAATKAAMIGFTKHLAAEFGPFGVRVNALAPGRIETPMVKAVGSAVNDEQVRLTPLGRLGTSDEVADVALYLTSAEASFVTGQTVDVAGGLYMT